jgi:hypothetical protein
MKPLLFKIPDETFSSHKEKQLILLFKGVDGSDPRGVEPINDINIPKGMC